MVTDHMGMCVIISYSGCDGGGFGFGGDVGGFDGVRCSFDCCCSGVTYCMHPSMCSASRV
jgi:hypothetical protein